MARRRRESLSPARTMLRGLSDEDVMVLYLDGYEGAFDEIYRRYRKLVLYIAQLELNFADAEDIAQDVFMRGIILNGWKFDRRKGTLKGWLSMITRRRCWEKRKWMEVRFRIHGWAYELMEKKGLTEKYDVDQLDHGYDQ
jgi:DNA-directed RNA polymerase specialized sigma24 family protein